MKTALMIHPDFDIAPLVYAVIEHAQREAQKGDRSARYWLLHDGLVWLDAVTDIHPDHVRRWVTGKGKRKPARRQDRARWAKYNKPVRLAQIGQPEKMAM
jgi:hypothetical protein